MDREEASKLVYEIDEEGKGLTDWEADFLDSMMKQLDKRPPSVDQAKIISKIYEDRVLR